MWGGIGRETVRRRKWRVWTPGSLVVVPADDTSARLVTPGREGEAANETKEPRRDSREQKQVVDGAQVGRLLVRRHDSESPPPQRSDSST